ncbi:MAG TPA: helix-turn-helix domain-containing protein [Terracidiphilus sp.]
MSEIRHFVHRPRTDLRPFVREIIWVRSDEERVQVLLPETAMTLVLRQSGDAWLNGQTLPGAMVSGLQERTRNVRHGGASSIIVVRFTEVGGPAILHDRVDLLFAKTTPLDAFISGDYIGRLQNHLADAPAIREQTAIVERFLGERIQPRNGATAQIAAAAGMIRASGGRAQVADIARRVAMSQSALERHFRAATGATPKMFSRLARLHEVCRLWDAGKNLTAIAYDAGYTDQPHMVRDFQLFTGMSPQQFFRTNSPRNLPTFYK